MKITSMPNSKSSEDLIEKKHKEYLKKAKLYSYLYYSTRLMAGFSAVLIPFIIKSSVKWSTSLSIIIALVTIIDLTLSPKDRWVLHSKATDMLAIARLKSIGEYDKYKESLEIIAQTEAANLQRLVDIDTLVEKKP